MSVTVECPATVQTNAIGGVECVDGTGAAVGWVVVPQFDIADLDSSTASLAFGAGFVLVGMCWAVGRGVQALLEMLK